MGRDIGIEGGPGSRATGTGHLRQTEETAARRESGDTKEARREQVTRSPENQSVQGGPRQTEDKAGDMEAGDKDERGNRPKRQGGEGRGQTQAPDRRDDYRDADGDRIREVKSIRGGGMRATRWEKVSKGGKELNENGNRGSNITSSIKATGRQNRNKNKGEEDRRKYK